MQENQDEQGMDINNNMHRKYFFQHPPKSFQGCFSESFKYLGFVVYLSIE